MTLVVQTPATSLALLSDAEILAAAGLSGGSVPDALVLVAAATAAEIMTECRIASDGAHAPTLLRETLVETLYLSTRREIVLLARRHVHQIDSVVEDGVALDAGDYSLNAEAGTLQRLRSDWPGCWSRAKLVVTYVAGFDPEAVPDDLKRIASDFIRTRWLEAERDPLVKSEMNEVPGVLVEKRDYWVGGLPQQGPPGTVPATIAARLTRYRNLRVA